MITRNVNDDQGISAIITFFREILKEKSADLHYDIEASVGYDFLKDSDDTAEACLKRADEKLYIDKKKNKR